MLSTQMREQGCKESTETKRKANNGRPGRRQGRLKEGIEEARNKKGETDKEAGERNGTMTPFLLTPTTELNNDVDQFQGTSSLRQSKTYENNLQ